MLNLFLLFDLKKKKNKQRNKAVLEIKYFALSSENKQGFSILCPLVKGHRQIICHVARMFLEKETEMLKKLEVRNF